MLISVNHHSPHKKNAGEIKCPYNQLGTIYDFIKRNPNKRYIIIADGAYSARLTEQIDFVKAVAQDYSVECGDLKVLKSLLKNGYNGFLKYPVTDWETFDGLKNLGVSDIYIDGPLGFQADLIAKTKGDIKIRVSPTISPNSSIGSRTANTFFIRPEDLSSYTFVDVIDFKETNQDREDALFAIYKRGSFNYNLDKLIIGLLPSVSNLLINPDGEFIKYRLNCGQRCKVPGGQCHYCDTHLKVGSHLMEYSKTKSTD